MNISKQERAALDAVLFRQQLDVDDDIKDKLLRHLHLVMECNKTLNLTRITNIEDAIILHIEDSLAVYREFTSVSGKFIDIGTGGGFPGIPLSLVSGKEGVLLDSVKKKADAVRKIVHQLNKNDDINVLGMRSEELAKERDIQFDIVIARAVSSLATVEEYATPLLKMNGIVISMRSEEASEDVEQALRAAKILGLEMIGNRSFSLNNEYKRSVFVFEKKHEPSISLPRRNGVAHKRPLGKR